MAGIFDDETSREMDDVLYGSPKQNPSEPSLDPKISEAMDKDLGIERPSIFPKTAVPEAEEPGYVGSLTKGLRSGLQYGLPQQISQSVERISQPLLAEGAVSPAKAVSDWAEEGQKKLHPEPYKNWAKEQLFQTGAMMAPSALPAAALGVLGLPAAAAVIPAAMFGLSQSQQTLDSAKDRMTQLQTQKDALIAQGDPEGKATGIQEEMDNLKKAAVPASLITGAIETFGETLGTIYLSKLFGPLAPIIQKGVKTTAGEIAKPTLRRFLRELPKTIGVEAGTEVFQNWTEAETEKRAGVRPEATPWEEGVAAIAPTIGMTLLTGGIAHPFEKVRARHIETALGERTSRENVQNRIGAVNEVAAKIEEADKEVAAKWREKAYQSVLKGEPIPLDADLMEWAGIPHLNKAGEKAAPEGAIKEEKPKESAITQEEEPDDAERETNPVDLITKEKATEEKPVEEETTTGSGFLSEIPEETPPPVEPPPETAIDLTAKPGEKTPVDFIGLQETGEPGGYFPMVNLPEGSTVNFNPEKHTITNQEEYEEAIKAAGTNRPTPPEEKKGEKTKTAIPEKRRVLDLIFEDLRSEKINLYEAVKEAGITETLFRKAYDAWEKKPKTAIPEEEIKAAGTSRPTAPKTEKAADISAAIEEEGKKAATSPESSLPEPTEGQKEAGNYQKGHVNLHGLDISIENPRGSERSNLKASDIEKLIASARGEDKKALENALASLKAADYSGARILLARSAKTTADNKALKGLLDKTWAHKLANAYGYIRGTKGKDKDHLDVFIGPNPESLKVFVIDQVKPETGKFDEHKVMMGFNSMEEAQKGYLANYAPDWKGMAGARSFSMDEFKAWLKEGDTTKPVAPEVTDLRTADTSKDMAIPGKSYRNTVEDLLSDDPETVKGTLAIIGFEVEKGNLDPKVFMNYYGNEAYTVAMERVTQKNADTQAELNRVSAVGERLKAALNGTKLPEEAIKETEAKGETKTAIPETKGAIPDTETPSRDTIMKDLEAGRISPTEAAAKLGVEVSELKKLVAKDIKEIKKAGTNRATGPKSEKQEIPKEWNKAFEERLRAVSPTGKVIALEFREGDRTLREAVHKDGYDAAKERLRIEAFRQFPELAPLGEEPKTGPAAGPDLTVSGQAKPVPDRPGVTYVVHKAKVGAVDDRPFRVTISQPTKGGQETASERGKTAEEAYKAALESFDALEKPEEKEEAGKKQEIKKAGAGPEKGKEGKTTGPAEASREFKIGDLVKTKNGRLHRITGIIPKTNNVNSRLYQTVEITEGARAPEKGTYKAENLELVPPEKSGEKTEEPAKTGNHWLRNKETGKIELYFNKADFDKLDAKVKERIRVRFLWAPSKKAWVSKATKDMFWPETIVRDLTSLGIFAKQEAPKAEKAGPEKPAAGEKKADIEAEVEKLTPEDLDKMLDEAFEEGKPAKEKQGMPTVEGDQARAYSPGVIEKPKPEDLGISKKDPQMRRLDIGKEQGWSDGYMVDLGELPYKTEGKIQSKVNDATELWNNAVAEATHALGDPWLFIPSTVNHEMDLIVWGTQVSAQPVALDLKYFNYFKSQYPAAEFFYGEDKIVGKVKGSKEFIPGVILVKSDGKPVGLVMPIRNKFLSFDDVEGFRPKEAKFVPHDDWQKHLMKARVYAAHLKIPHVGKSLSALVEAINAKLAAREAKAAAPAEKKSLKDILTDVKDLGVKGADEAMKGLYELFGGSALKSFPAGFDADTYAKAKPHFEASFKAFKEAGLNLKEFFAEVRTHFGNAVKPYLRYFIQEKMGEAEELPSVGEDQPDLTENTGKGERGARKKLTEQEKAEKEAKEKAAAEKKARKAGMGEFKNVGYVYDPEHLNQKTKDKAPRSAGKIILDEMTPGKLWDVEFAEEATHGVVRMKNQVQNMFKTFRDYLLYKSEIRNYGGRRASMEAKLDAWFTRGQGNIEKLKEWAKEYGHVIQPYISAFEGQTSITGAIGRLQEAAYPGVGIKYPWPATREQIPEHGKSAPFNNYQDINSFTKFGSERYFFDFLKKDWQSLLGQENEILLSEIDVNKRGRNTNVVRAGLPDYREGVDLKKTEDFQAPFGFKGVGFGEEGWINQEERNRVIPAAYDAFKDLAATIQAPDKGMSLGGDLAVQFANLGHKARGSAAAYFPSIQTINFTRDNGDGTMAHEWGHALHALAAPKAIDEINAIIKTLNHVYDFDAGERLANDLLARDSQFLKRIISSKKQERIQAVKERIRQDYYNHVRKETDYFKTAQQMDADYTARAQEMWARAWEAFIHDTLAGTNNYLVTDFVAAGRVGGHAGVGTMLVYPAGKEREKFNETIQHFVDGLTWDENGKPFLKDDYETIDKHNEALLKTRLEELLATVEERYKAIWTSEPSKDGKFWYRYDATEFAPMMQPEGYVGYDKEYKALGNDGLPIAGKGAVAYLTQLHPDLIMDFKLSNIKYEGENPTYISAEEGGIPNGGIQEHGETELGEERPGHGKGDEKAGDIRDRTGPGSQAGVGGARTPGKSGGAVSGGEGGRGAEVHPRGAGNYRITDPTLNDPKSIDRRFIANLAAVRILKELESTGREITPRDKDILAQYTGMGGFAELFAYEPSAGWKERADLLKGELDREEEQAAASSAPSAYYTPVPVGQFMWKLAQRLGFKGGLVLEPSMGANGLFFGTLPEELEKSTTLQGIEKDSISARIASRLYEKANIENKPFQEANKPNNRADLTIGNVPFQNFVVTDSKHNKGGFTLANYFVNKSLNLTAPGTLSMLITPTSTMDGGGANLKEYSAKADLVGAIRLPSGIYAGSDVVCDILVFRKKIEGSKFKGIATDVWTQASKDSTTGVMINKYFLDHPDMIAGKLEKVTGRYGDDAFRVAPEGDLQDNLARIAAAFPEKIVEREATKTVKSLDDLIAAPGTVKEGGIYVNAKGQVAIKEGGEEVLFPTATAGERQKAQIAKGFVKLLDQVRNVLRVQKTEIDKDLIKSAQEALKTEYDAFVKAHGPINNPSNVAVYNDVTDSPWVLALEDYNPRTGKVDKLADIFTKEIIPSQEKPDHAETDHDALAMSLDEFGYPNLEYMAKLRKSDTVSVLKGVQDKVIENPETGFLETMDEYLSGNVKKKLQVARDMAESNPEYKRNVKVLEAARPAEIPAHRITARIGASWIHPDHLSNYVKDKMALGGNLTALFHFSPVTNEWKMSFRGHEGRRGEVKAETDRQIYAAQKSVEATRMWGTPYRNFFLLMQDAIEGRRPIVSYYDRDLKKTVIDATATKGAEAKLNDIQRDFSRWLFADPSRGREAVERFNEVMNTSVPMISDGSHLTFPGKSLEVLTAKESKTIGIAGTKVFYPHQPNAVWKYLRNGNLYLGHEVGSGKTMTMAMIGMEAKRLRGKKKVLYVTHSDSTMDQGIAEIKRLYPLANVLPVRVSTNEERKQLAMQKIAMNDFDIAVMRQQDLDRIALSPDAERVFIQQDLEELREVLEDLRKQGAKLQERDIQTRISALEEQLKETVHEEAKRKNLFFDDLGIDLMITDEAHSYKNVPYATRLSRITGLNPAGSPTARAFFRKTQFLNAAFPKRDAVVLGSGTPLTNSIAELYNIQRMLQPQEVKRLGVWNFDRWIANFGEIGSDLEWDGARGEYKSIVTNRRIVNAGRLLATAFQNVDSVLAKNTPIKRPKIRQGEPQRVKIKPNQYVEDYKAIVLERCKELEDDPRHAMFEGVPDNMLRIISNMSKVAIDQRLDSRYANTPMQQDSKIYQASRNIFKRWQEETEHKGVQLVFADLGVPHRFAAAFKPKSDEDIAKMSHEDLQKYLAAQYEFENRSTGFNVYDALKSELVKLGIPAKEIAFIHDADSGNKDKKKANLRALFRQVNNGEIRVLIGSTSKAGTGVNVQERVSDVHHLDVWWNFSAWAQRNGRGIRAGNIYTDLNKGTDKEGTYIWNYVTETTVDATRWDKVFAKGRVLNSVLDGDINLDVIEDISEETLSAKLMAAEASGDPLMAKHATLLNRVQNLRMEQSSYLDNVRSAKMELAGIPARIAGYQNDIKQGEKSRAIVDKVTAVQFVGKDQTLILEKNGKEIAEGLVAALKSSLLSDPKGEEKLNILVAGSHEETEVKEIVDKKEKKVKKITFHPLPVQMYMAERALSPTRPQLVLTGDILSEQRDLAEIELNKKGAIKSYEIKANVSRTFTEYVNRRAHEDKWYKETIDSLKEKEPKLKTVAETPWDKQEEFEGKLKELEDVEREMAERGNVAGRPELGMKMEHYEAPVPAVDDIAPKESWRTYALAKSPYNFPIGDQTVYWPNSAGNEPPFAFRTQAPLKDFARNRTGKFEAEFAESYNLPEDLQLLSGPPLADKPAVKPYGFTTIDNKTKFWVPIDKGKSWVTVDPTQWSMLERIVPDGSWHFEGGRMSGDFLVHIDEKGQRDAFIRAQRENAGDIPAAFKDYKPSAAPPMGPGPLLHIDGREETPSAGEDELESHRDFSPVTERQFNQLSDLVSDMVGTVPLFKEVVTIDLAASQNRSALQKHGYSPEKIQEMIDRGDNLYYVHGTMTPVRVSENQWKATIEVAYGGRDYAQVLHTSLHEAFEQARFFMLKPDEWTILNRRFPADSVEAANEIQSNAFAKYWKRENIPGLGNDIRKIFAKIASFFEAIGNYLHGLGYHNSKEIFDSLASGAIRRRLRVGQVSTGKVTRFQEIPHLDAQSAKFLDAMKSGDMAQKAEQDKGFKAFIKTIRFGLVKITDPDLKNWERILSLPYWLQDKYRELRPLVKTQMNREEARSQMVHDLVKRSQDFFTLKGDQFAQVEKAISTGDRANKVYDENTLRGEFQLDTAGIRAYRAARSTLDFIHNEWGEKIEKNFLQEFERERWYSLFKAAHDFELTEEETGSLARALSKTYKAQELPVQTVRRHLQKIFNEKLTQDDKRLLVKNYVEAWHKAKAALIEIKAIVKSAIGEDMSDEDLNKNVKALVQAYVRSEPQAKLLKEMRSELNRIRGYFPRSQKQGKYFVRVSTLMEDQLGNQVPVTLFRKNAANRIEATRIYNQVIADPQYKGMKVAVEPLRQEADNTFMGASAINMQRLVDNAIEKMRGQGSIDVDTAAEMRMNVLETLADDLKARGAGAHSIRRSGHIIEGYQTTNLKEVLKDYIDGWAGMMTKQDAALEFLEELKDIPRSKPQLNAYASKYAQDMLRNQEKMDRVSAKFRGGAFLYFLGGSLRAALVNFTQNYVTGIPFLAREVGWKSLKAEKLYHKAMFDAAMGGKNLSPAEARMLKEMIDKGIAEDQYIQQITRETKHAMSKRMADVTQLLATPFGWIERLNRRSAALAMFRVAHEKAVAQGRTAEQAYKTAFAKAESYVYKTHYLMTKANLPSMAAGGDVGSQFLKTAYTFRRFTHNFLLGLQNSFRGPDGKIALDVMGRSLAYIAILGGVPALPFLDDLMDLWEKFFGTPLRSHMRKTMREIGGPVMEKMGMAGIPALIGIDISGSLKTQLPWPLSQGTPADTITGVYGGLLQKFINAKDSLQRDDTLRAIEFASPAFLEAALKAYRLTEQGVTNPKGKIMTDEEGKPIRLEASEAVTQGLGFRPERMSEISGEHRTEQNVKAYFTDKRDDLYARYRLAKTSDQKKAIVKDMQKFNMEARKLRGVIPPITMSSLREAVRQRPDKGFMRFGNLMEEEEATQ